MTPSCPSHSRRRFLSSLGTVTAASVGLAGCLADEADSADSTAAPEPIALTDGQTCDACGMTIADHDGPAGQVFYADAPDDRDGPARFDSVRELLVFDAEHTRRGWDRRAAFVTDYSSVDYALREREGTTSISSHVAADEFADATGLSYVVDSEIGGSMGADIVPFSDRDDAATFADTHGGTVQSWDGVRSSDAPA